MTTQPARAGRRLLALAVLAVLLTLMAGRGGQAHDLPHALAEVRIAPGGTLDVALRVHLTPMILGAPQAAPDEAAAGRLAALSDAEIAARGAAVERQLAEMLTLRADRRVIEDLTISFPSPADVRAEALTPRGSPQPSAPIRIAARTPPGTVAIDIALPPSLGPAFVSVRYPDGRTVTAPLTDGQQSPAFRLAGPRPWLDAAQEALRFLRLGFGHIVPGGPDHLLFIIALAMGAPRFGPLARLVTTFTVAHSITLSLAALGFVAAPAALVEPAITLSIALAALMSLRGPEAVGWGRLALVFGFGLLHGLGFAAALRDAGLPRGSEVAALAAFNIGVEVAQLAVIATVVVALRLAARVSLDPQRLRRPVALSAALIGVVWTAHRIVIEFGPAAPGLGGTP